MPNSSCEKRLLVSIHDVCPPFEGQVDALLGRLRETLGGTRLAMLVVPNFRDEAPLSRSPAFRARLRAWSDEGVEMILHGWTHRDDQHHSGRWTAFKARHFTAREGEFLGLSRGEAERRIALGRAMLEDAIGRPVDRFVAPAWLYGEGSRAALRDQGFALAEDHWRVWRPDTGTVLARGPVITWASRSPRRRASSLAFAAVARHALAAMPVVRVATHPGDVGSPPIMASIDRTMRTLLRHRHASAYGELMRI